MCDLNAVSALIAAAEIGALVTLAALGVAVVLSGNLYTALSTTIPMVTALIALGLAIASLSTAAGLLSACADGPCAVPVHQLQGALAALISALTITGVAIGVGLVFASIPWAGTAAVIGLIAGLLLASVGFGGVATALNTLDACEKTASSLPAAVVWGGYAIAGIVSLGLLIVTGYGRFRPDQ